MRTPVKIGLGVAGLLGAVDLATPFATDGEHPPMVVALLAAALGLATLAALLPAWRGSRTATFVVAATRGLSALTALPAFFVPDVPAAAIAAASVGVALTLIAVALLVPVLRPTTA